MADISVRIKNVTLKTPVIAASGTFGSGEEIAGLIDINEIGAITAKTVTLEPRDGNPSPRIFETASGIINSIGLQNKGIDHFVSAVIPFFENYEVPFIANIAGFELSEYAKLASILDKYNRVNMIELNVSCPNVKKGGIEFGRDPAILRELVTSSVAATSKPVIVKLSPNVTDIAELARVAEDSGASAISLVNTFQALAINIDTLKPELGGGLGGLSGPAIKPIALRMVYQVSNAVKIPVIGMGGISSSADAIEFILAGATAVSVGTANFIDPSIAISIADGINEYLDRKGYVRIQNATGKFKLS